MISWLLNIMRLPTTKLLNLGSCFSLREFYIYNLYINGTAGTLRNYKNGLNFRGLLNIKIFRCVAWVADFSHESVFIS